MTSLNVKPCSRCGKPIALVQNKAGKWYPADVEDGAIAWSGAGILGGKRRQYIPPHRCGLSLDDQLARAQTQLAAARRALQERPADDWWPLQPYQDEIDRWDNEVQRLKES